MLIEEAVGAGARLDRACKTLGLSVRTLQRWVTVTSGDRSNPASCGHVKSGQSFQDAGRVTWSTSVLQVCL